MRAGCMIWYFPIKPGIQSILLQQVLNRQMSQFPCKDCRLLIYRGQSCPNCRAKCRVCTYQNHKSALSCQMCDSTLPEPDLKHEEDHQPVITCPKCNKPNDLSNEVCVYCEHDLFTNDPKLQCSFCGMAVKSARLQQHEMGCKLSLKMIEQEELQRKELQAANALALKLEAEAEFEECINCRQKLPSEEMRVHERKCSRKAEQADLDSRLTKLQVRAIMHMQDKSAKEHLAAKKSLQDRMRLLKLTMQDLNNLHFYVENYAPIIIHVHLSKHLQFFVKDTHYRNQFETNQSSGSLSRASRTTWEDRMFDKMYAKATDHERVKYGVINFTNDPKGVGACVAYGHSYFLLKEHVRHRCTFTDMDSSNSNATIGTFRHCFAVLNKMTDAELKAALEASKAQEIGSHCTTAYKEIQIHGPIEFGKDIERIYVNRQELQTDKTILDMVYEFSRIHAVDHDFF